MKQEANKFLNLGIGLLMSSLFLLPGAMNAQSTITIGTDLTSDPVNGPIRGISDYSYSQFLYTATDFATAGWTNGAGEITKMRFHLNSSPNATQAAASNDWTVYVGNTTTTSLAAGPANFTPTSAMTQVYSGTVNLSQGWVELTFTAPFNYTGDNLIVAIDENAAGRTTPQTAILFSFSNFPNSTTIYHRKLYSNSVNPNPANLPGAYSGTAETQTGRKPNVQFVIDIVGGSTCLAPTIAQHSNVTTTSAVISWTAPSSAPSNGYEYYYSQSNTPPSPTTTPSGSVTSGTSATISPLNNSTPYYWWVRSDCGSSKSVWTIVDSFVTVCPPETVPYTMNFETSTIPAIPLCTSIENAGTGYNWKTATQLGNKVLRYPGNATANAWFYTHAIQLTAGTSYDIKYQYWGNGYSENLKVAYGTTPTFSNMTSTLANHLGFIDDTPTTNTVTFTVPTTGVYYFGFNAYSDPSASFFSIDNILIEETPNCYAPNLAPTASGMTYTTATISWNATTPAPADGHEYYYSTSNTAPIATTTPSGATVAGVNSAALTLLTPMTHYFVWVRSVCSIGNKSVWSPMGTFYTGHCIPIATNNTTHINGVSTTGAIVNLNNPSSGPSSNGYSDYFNTDSIVIGNGSNLTVPFTIAGGPAAASIYIDLNDDVTFSTSEKLYTSNAFLPIGNHIAIVPIPASATPGSYRLRIILDANALSPSACSYYDGIGEAEDYKIKILNCVMPVFNLGADSVEICQGTPLTLSTGLTTGTHSWNTGATTSSINVTTSGTYVVSVANGACILKDSVVVTVMPSPSIDSIAVSGTSPNFTFTAVNPLNVGNYSWNLGNGNTENGPTLSSVTENYNVVANDQSIAVTLTISNDCGDVVITKNIIVKGSVGIKGLDMNPSDLKLYPNPSQNTVTIENNSPFKMKQVLVSNLVGQVQVSQTVHQFGSNIIDVSNLPSGLYQIMIEFEEGKVVRKLNILK